MRENWYHIVSHKRPGMKKTKLNNSKEKINSRIKLQQKTKQLLPMTTTGLQTLLLNMYPTPPPKKPSWDGGFTKQHKKKSCKISVDKGLVH